jgi:dephospho-CoA kinase
MKVIGLTGGIGSGKSTVARVFESLGYPVFDADREAINLYTDDPTLLPEVVSLFGNSVLQSDGTLNRKSLASLVFTDASALQKLNSLVHPRVAERFAYWKSQQVSSLVMREAAILFESGSNVDCHAVIVVTSPEKLRLQRVMKRNAMSEVEVKARMARQWSEEELLRRADFQIMNDEQTLLLPQVMRIADQLRGI